MPKPLKSLVERRLAKRVIKDGKVKVKLSRRGKRHFLTRIGFGTRRTNRYYNILRKLHGKKEIGYFDAMNLNAYAKIVSFITKRLGSNLINRKILEIGPGNMVAQLKFLKKRGADLYTIEPEPSAELRALARNERSAEELEKYFPGTKFDLVYSRGIFEPYSVKGHSGLSFLQTREGRLGFLNHLAGRVKPGGILIFGTLNEWSIIERRELEEAGFEIVTERRLPLPKTKQFSPWRISEFEYFLIAKRKYGG